MNDKEIKILISQIKVLLLTLQNETGMKITFNIPPKVKLTDNIKAEITQQM